YGDVRLADERQFSEYNFQAADVAHAWEHFRLYEEECKALIRKPCFRYEATPTSIEWSWPDLILKDVYSRYFKVPAGRFADSNLNPDHEYEFRLFRTSEDSVSLQRFESG